MKENNNNSEQESSTMTLEYYSQKFWDNFYKNPKLDTRFPINWYFDITKVKIDGFFLNDLSKSEEILVLGPGLSSILEYFYENNYEKITLFDFSEELIQILTEKYNKQYNKDWSINFIDISETNNSFNSEFNIIIDKGCLDCIISEPKQGQDKFIKAFNNLMLLLNDDGVFYYFSTANDRENLFHLGPKIKYETTKIDLNKNVDPEFQKFKEEDNIYYLYTIQKIFD
jgi:hypothetical protein